MVQARIMNQLLAVALNEGLRCEKRLWRSERQQLKSFRLAPWASQRRHELLELLRHSTPRSQSHLCEHRARYIRYCPETGVPFGRVLVDHQKPTSKGAPFYHALESWRAGEL